MRGCVAFPRAVALAGSILFAMAACTPAVDSLKARRDKEEAIVPGSAGHASTCVADAVERAGGSVLLVRIDPEMPVTEVAASYRASGTTGPEFRAWYEFSARDGTSARVVYSFDAADQYRQAARSVVLAPVRTCGGDSAP
jgi:hypothetical protein